MERDVDKFFVAMAQLIGRGALTQIDRWGTAEEIVGVFVTAHGQDERFVYKVVIEMEPVTAVCSGPKEE